MLRFLKAKMVEKNVNDKDIAFVIKKDPRTVRARIAEDSDFTWPEVCAIWKAFFSDCDKDALFASDREQNSA